MDEEVSCEYFTANGERVRSKSEIIIADHLRRYGVVYKYEKPLELTVHGRRVTFYPDFTVMNSRTGRIYYLEHFGMMDNEDYYNAVLRKLDAFEMNQLLIGRDVLLLHESSSAPLNTRVLDCYIQEFLVWGAVAKIAKSKLPSLVSAMLLGKRDGSNAGNLSYAT